VSVCATSSSVIPVLSLMSGVLRCGVMLLWCCGAVVLWCCDFSRCISCVCVCARNMCLPVVLLCLPVVLPAPVVDAVEGVYDFPGSRSPTSARARASTPQPHTPATDSTTGLVAPFINMALGIDSGGVAMVAPYCTTGSFPTSSSPCAVAITSVDVTFAEVGTTNSMKLSVDFNATTCPCNEQACGCTIGTGNLVNYVQYSVSAVVKCVFVCCAVPCCAVPCCAVLPAVRCLVSGVVSRRFCACGAARQLRQLADVTNRGVCAAHHPQRLRDAPGHPQVLQHPRLCQRRLRPVELPGCD